MTEQARSADSEQGPGTDREPAAARAPGIAAGTALETAPLVLAATRAAAAAGGRGVRPGAARQLAASLGNRRFARAVRPAGRTLSRTRVAETRLAQIESELGTVVISDEHRTELERERDALLRGGNKTGLPASGAASAPMKHPLPALAPVPVPVISLSVEEFEALTGQSASSLPAPPGAEGEAQTSGGLPPSWTVGPASVGIASQYATTPAWYYRVLSSADPAAREILHGAGLSPRPPGPGYSFQPAANRADMTFRHLRPGGNVPQIGTDRISTAMDLEAFETLLKERGTGELVRVDPEAARRLGAEFLEHGEVLADLDEIGARLSAELDAARAAGRGKNYIARIESRLRALEAAKAYAATFQEGQGVGRVPGRAMTQVKGATLGEAVAGERALVRNLRYFRYGGRVLIVVGVVMSVERVASAPPQEQARIATQEAGGWAFSLAGGAAGAKAGAALGAAAGIESGPGAIATAVIGALIGGALGFFLGEAVADELYDVGARAAERMRSIGDTSKLIYGPAQMFVTEEDERRFYEMRALETGELTPEF